MTRECRRPSSRCTRRRETCSWTEDRAAADAGDDDDDDAVDDRATGWNGREDSGTCR